MRLNLHPVVAAAATIVAAAFAPQSASADAPHNVLLFVADGLRPGMVNAQNAPTMAALLQRGVRFPNSHSLFPTFTTANASAMATGHMLGDTGDFSNTIDAGFPVPGAGDSLTPFLEATPCLATWTSILQETTSTRRPFWLRPVRRVYPRRPSASSARS